MLSMIWAARASCTIPSQCRPCCARAFHDNRAARHSSERSPNERDIVAAWSAR